MAYKQPDKSSPYYYGEDSTYVPTKRTKSKPKPRPEFTLDANGLPVRTNGRSSALPSLGRYDDIPAAQYPEGIPTGTGGGNAGQAQSVDKDGDAYIPPTPKPKPDPPTPDTGRNTTRVSKTGVQQTGTQMGPRIATVAELEALAGGSIRDIFAFHSVNLPTTETGDNKINPNNFLVNGKQTSVDNMSEEDAFSMAHTMGKTSEFLRGYDGEQGDVSAMLDYAQNNGWSKTGITPAEQAPPGDFKGAQSDFNKYFKTSQAEGKANEKAAPNRVVMGENGTEFGGDYGPDYSTGKSWADARADLAFLDGNVDSMTALKNIERDKYGMVHTSSGKFGVSGGKAFKFSDEGVKAIKSGNFDPEKAGSYVDTTWNQNLTGKTAGGNTKPEENASNPSKVQQPDFDGATEKAANLLNTKVAQVRAALNAEGGAGGTKREGPAGFMQEDWSRSNTVPAEVTKTYNENKDAFNTANEDFKNYFNQ